KGVSSRRSTTVSKESIGMAEPRTVKIELSEAQQQILEQMMRQRHREQDRRRPKQCRNRPSAQAASSDRRGLMPAHSRFHRLFQPDGQILQMDLRRAPASALAIYEFPEPCTR